MSFHTYVPHGSLDAKVDPQRCAAAVADAGGFRFVQCGHRASYQENGHGWCGHHRPKFVERKRAENAAKLNGQLAAQRLRREIEDAEREVARVAVECYDKFPLPPTLAVAVDALKKLRGS